MYENLLVAMVGAGGMANRVHYPSLVSFGAVGIAAIGDLDSAHLTATADKYEVEGVHVEISHDGGGSGARCGLRHWATIYYADIW